MAVRPKDFVFPSMSITKIDFTGQVTIKFSDPFVARQDLQILKEFREINILGDKQANFQLVIDPIPDQDPGAVAFTWEP